MCIHTHTHIYTCVCKYVDIVILCFNDVIKMLKYLKVLPVFGIGLFFKRCIYLFLAVVNPSLLHMGFP